jgi:hypothetical protein
VRGTTSDSSLRVNHHTSLAAAVVTSLASARMDPYIRVVPSREPAIIAGWCCIGVLSNGRGAEGPTPGTTGDGSGGSFSAAATAILRRFICWPAVLGALRFARAAVVAAGTAELTVAEVESVRVCLGAGSW